MTSLQLADAPLFIGAVSLAGLVVILAWYWRADS